MKNHMKFFFVYLISYKTLIVAKSFRIRFNKTDGIIRVHDWTRYLVLFGPGKCVSI